MHATVFSTTLGWIAVCWRDNRLVALSFGRPTEVSACKALQNGRSIDDDDTIEWLQENSLSPIESQLVERLRKYANGASDDFSDVELDLGQTTDFERRVIGSCRRVGYGQTTTYGELAVRAGAPRAARAVGNVMRKNCVPLIIPCHRVLASGGSLGGYSAPEGLTMKKRLLRMESQA